MTIDLGIIRGAVAGLPDDKMLSVRADVVRALLPPEPVETVSAEDDVTMAEEPIEDRLRRAWLNGFRDGVEQGAWREGQWDRR
jgi:hypothetical protein